LGPGWRTRSNDGEELVRAQARREYLTLPRLDRWLAGKFDPGSLPQTIAELHQAQDVGTADAATEQARREVAGCDAKLRRHRAALEAAADPVIVAGWIAEVQAQPAVAEAQLRHSPRRQRMCREEITRLLTSLRDLVGVLADADPAGKAEVYTQLGLSLTYDPGGKKVQAEARPLMYVRKCPRSKGT
jgi:hypothetical protein